MSAIEILLPFGLPPPELARDLLRDLRLPALSTLLARGSAIPPTTGRAPAPGATAGSAGSDENDGGFARALPHETWLAEHFGLADAMRTSGSPPVATAFMRSLGLAPAPGHWFIVQPVHLHVARDHLVLTDPRQLGLSTTESHALFETAGPCFEEQGLSLFFGTTDCWFVRADRHADLLTSTPDATCGRNIDIWMPQGASAREWRKLQNEVQMAWFADPVNAAREDRRVNPVNSLWLWGGATYPQPNRMQRPEHLFGFDGWTQAFGYYAAGNQPQATPESVFERNAEDRESRGGQEARLLLCDGLIGPALGGDWSEWRQRLEALETRWFAPALAAVTRGAIGGIRLTLSDSTRLQSWETRRASLRKFWVKPALGRLLP